jgi:hypothetical protein
MNLSDKHKALANDMTIPVDEMLSELRDVLEEFDREKTQTNLDLICKETRRIEHYCEDI